MLDPDGDEVAVLSMLSAVSMYSVFPSIQDKTAVSISFLKNDFFVIM